MSVRRLSRLAGVVAAAAALTAAGGLTVVAASAPPPAGPTVSISLADHGRTANGNALLRVTYTCSIPADAHATLAGTDLYITEVTQGFGAHEASGSGYTSGFACDGTPQRRTLTVVPWTDAGFGGGQATVTLDATVCWWSDAGESICASDSVDHEPVRLRGGGTMPPATQQGDFPVSLSAVGRVSHGVAHLTVAYGCAVPAIADQWTTEIRGLVRQQRTRLHSAQGGFDVWDGLVCDGQTHRLRVDVPSTTATRFSVGPVTATVYADLHWDDLDDCADDGDDCAEGYLSGTLEGATATLRDSRRRS
jgi:hypothetical protein